MNKHTWRGAALLGASIMTGAAFAAETSYSHVILTDQPFLYWSFDETEGDALQKAPLENDEPSPNDLVPFGATRVSHASVSSGLNLGNAADLDGASYFMAENLEAHTSSIAGPYLIEFWMQVQGSIEDQRNDYLVNFGAGGGNAPAVIYDYIGSAQGRFGLELYAGSRTGAGAEAADVQWHHVAFVYYGNGIVGVADRLDIYIDGVNVAPYVRDTFVSSLNLAARLVVGTSTPQFAAGDGFEGRLDELAVYDLSGLETETAVNAKADAIATGHFAQAKAANYTQAVLADRPALYWNFNEADGSARQLAPVTPDGTETSNDLVPTGDLLRYSHTELDTGLNLGRLIDLDGTGMMRAEDLALGVTALEAPWAIEFWMQALGPDDGRRSDYVLSMGQSGGNEPAVIFDYMGAEEDNAIELFHLGGRTGSGPSINDSDWHHILIVSYGNGTVGVADRIEMFLDGASQGSNIRNTFTHGLNLDTQFIVGNSPVPADGFEGRMDEVAVYSFAAVATETELQDKVADLAARRVQAARDTTAAYTATVLADKPILYYNFEETEGNAIQRAPVGAPPEPAPENSLVSEGAERASHADIGSGLDLGHAAQFNGATYFIAEDLNAPKLSLTAPWMLEFWLQVQGANEGLRSDYLMNFGGGGGNQPAVLFDYVGGLNPDNGLELYAGGRTGAGPVVGDAAWHHALFVYYGDGTTGVADKLDIYLDGVLAGSDARNTFGAALIVDSRFVVGTSAPQFAAGDGFEGRIDEIALYDLSSLSTEAAVTARAADYAARHFAAAVAIPVEFTLEISLSGNQITVSWPALATGYRLEQTTTLTDPQWQAVDADPTPNGNLLQVTLAADGAARFLRLARPN